MGERTPDGWALEVYLLTRWGRPFKALVGDSAEVSVRVTDNLSRPSPPKGGLGHFLFIAQNKGVGWLQLNRLRSTYFLEPEGFRRASFKPVSM